MAPGGGQPGRGRGGQPQGAGAVRPGDGGGPGFHHRRQRGRDPQGEGPGGPAEEAAGPVAVVLREAPRLAGGGDRPGVAVGAWPRRCSTPASLYAKVDAPAEGDPDAPRGAGPARGTDAGAAGRPRSPAATWAAAAWRWRICSLCILAADRRGAGRIGAGPRRPRTAGPGAARRRRCPAGCGPSAIRSTACSVAPAGTHEGRAAIWSGRRRSSRRLVHDNPPYTLPTAADGPTEYRRGLAEVLAGIAASQSGCGDEEAPRVWEAAMEVLEELTSGPFADDGDRRRLGLTGIQRIAEVLRASDDQRSDPDGRSGRRRSSRGSLDANPTVATYKSTSPLCLAISARAIATWGTSREGATVRHRGALDPLRLLDPGTARERMSLVMRRGCSLRLSRWPCAGRLDEGGSSHQDIASPSATGGRGTGSPRGPRFQRLLGQLLLVRRA